MFLYRKDAAALDWKGPPCRALPGVDYVTIRPAALAAPLATRDGELVPRPDSRAGES